jgi:putative redox protein
VHQRAQDGALLLNLGGCSAYDVVHILRKGRQQVTDCVADLDATRAHSDPRCS